MKTFKEYVSKVDESVKFHQVWIKDVSEEDIKSFIVSAFAVLGKGDYDYESPYDTDDIYVYRKGKGGMGMRNAKKLAQLASRKGWHGYITDEQYTNGESDSILNF